MQYIKIVFFSILLMQCAGGTYAALRNFSIQGIDIVTNKNVFVEPGKKKALVAVFLSSVCPCSNSHTKELSLLAKEYPDFAFVAVHSNTDESKEVSKAYFDQAKLPFPVIQDNGAKIANQLKALKTPHAFVIRPDGEIAYQGGVSSSQDFAKADKKYLREAIEDIQSGRAIRNSVGRTLGCVISRSGKNVW